MSKLSRQGEWVCSTPLIEEMPSIARLMPDLDELMSDFPDEDATTSKVLRANRAPPTKPPAATRSAGPLPAPLFNEPPDPFERTPATFDMGLLPATYAELEVTESKREEDLQPDVYIEQEETGFDIVHRPQPTDQVQLRWQDSQVLLEADEEASITIELLTGWMVAVEPPVVPHTTEQRRPLPNKRTRARIINASAWLFGASMGSVGAAFIVSLSFVAAALA